jgi:predicted enzyme related to lactoylglutathione lyase
MDMGPMGKYQFGYHGGVMIGAIMPRMPQMPVSLWTFYVGVDDIDRAAAAMATGGGQVLNGPHQIARRRIFAQRRQSPRRQLRPGRPAPAVGASI